MKEMTRGTLILALLTACGAPARPLPSSALARLHAEPTAHGALVYTGDVVPQGADASVFRYERRVRDGASTHLTFPVAGGAPVVLQRAEHDEAYALTRFEEINAQTGVRASVTVERDGSVDLVVRRGDEVERHHEHTGAPVVVGPTLFGFVRAHLDALRAGETVQVRFATPEQGRTWEFELKSAVDGAIEMRASDFFARLGIATMRIVLDPETDAPTSYHGRVPPRLDGSAFDADVRYSYAGRGYR